MTAFARLTAAMRSNIECALQPRRPWSLRYALWLDDDRLQSIMIYRALIQVDEPMLAGLFKPAARLWQQREPAARSSGGTPSKSERRRFELMREIGCVPCILEGELRGQDWRGTPPDVDHVVEGYRLGHSETYASCPYHHRAISPRPGLSTPFQLVVALGESKAISRKRYAARYGDEADLLQIQNIELAVAESRLAHVSRETKSR